jgi:hypothetical protein
VFFKKLYLSFLIVVLPVDVEVITKEDDVFYNEKTNDNFRTELSRAGLVERQ